MDVPRRLARKRLDFFAHDRDAALVRGVELEHARAEEVWAVGGRVSGASAMALGV